MKRVLKSKVPDIENAYVLVSAHRGQYVPLEYLMSFVWMDENVAVEWEPEHGPIQIFHRAARDGVEHYTFDYVCKEPLNWSQLAVEREGLQEAFIDGEYEYIFFVLKKWAESRPEPTFWEDDDE